jgi:hypothetical protein
MAVGQIFEAGNNIDQANLAYGRALAADPGFTPARVANVGVLIRKGQTDAALADAQKIVQESRTTRRPSSSSAASTCARATGRTRHTRSTSR